jgi:hypothetical protein
MEGEEQIRRHWPKICGGYKDPCCQIWSVNVQLWKKLFLLAMLASLMHIAYFLV